MISLVWAAFIAFILAMLALDLGVFNRRAKVVSARAALCWTGATVVLALLFAVVVARMYGEDLMGMGAAYDRHAGIAADVPHAGRGGAACMDYLSAWLVEYALSLDNILVIAMIFAHFKVPAEHQHRVLFWGVLGALVMRGAMIAAGAVALAHVHWLLYLLGAFLVYTALRILFAREKDEFDAERGWAVRMARRFFRISEDYEGPRFFTRIQADSGRTVLAATPLFIVLVVVELTDVIFAVDSIPAVFTITRDPFLVFSSNVFAILGLRSLYFALAGMIDRFRHLKPAIAFVLIFVGGKMLAEIWSVEIPHVASLAVIISILGTGIGISAFSKRRA